jgi:serine/threonine protein phosphatase PrpC
MTLALRYAVRSDVGLLREGNEDSAYAGPHLLAVADGMGGHAAGEVASAATITTLASLDAETQTADLVGALADAVASANMRLHELISSDPAIEGMGTTLTAMLWSEGYAALCHIGDSRAYLLRGGEFVQVTHDHTLVQSLVDEGKITEDDVATHPHRSLLLRALDGRTVAEPDLNTIETLPGDRFLLCSDGLSGVVTEQTLRQTLTSVRDPDKAALQLVELAIRGGGPDNITVIIADVVDTQASAAPPTFTPVLAGAAANGGPAPTRTSSPATRAMRLTRTMPQPTVPDEPTTGIWPGGYRDGYTGTFEASKVDANGFGSGGRAAPGLDTAGFERTGFDGAGTAVDEDDGRPSRRRAGSHARGRHAGHAGDGEDADGDNAYDQRGKRRWPIVKMSLVLLVVLLGAGAYGAWWYNQRQYFVGQQDGFVSIFRGTNQSIAGISLSSLVNRSSLPLSELGTSDQGAIGQTISQSSLTDAKALVASLQAQANQCHQKWAALVTWQSQEVKYQQKVAAARKAKSKAAPTGNPGAMPPMPDAADCAPAAEYGITSGLPSQASTTPPAPTPTATPVRTPTSTAKATTKTTAKPSGTAKAKATP